MWEKSIKICSLNFPNLNFKVDHILHVHKHELVPLLTFSLCLQQHFIYVKAYVLLLDLDSIIIFGVNYMANYVVTKSVKQNFLL